MANKNFFSLESGFPSKEFELAAIRNGYVVIRAYYISLAYLTYEKKRYGYVPFYAGDKVILPFYAGMVMHKGFPCKDSIYEVVTRLIGGGIINHRLQSYIPEEYLNFRKEGIKELGPAAFGMDNFLGAIIIIAFGLFASIARFLWECCISRGR